MSRRVILVAALLGTVLLAVGGEVWARATLDARLARAQIPVEFTGPSALVAALTRHVQLTATITADYLERRLAERLDSDPSSQSRVVVTGIELVDDAVGVDVEIGTRGLAATAWVTLTPAATGLEATVVSIAAGGLQIPPAAILGDRTDIALDDLLAGTCADPTVDAVTVDPDGVRVTLTTTPETVACLRLEET